MCVSKYSHTVLCLWYIQVCSSVIAAWWPRFEYQPGKVGSCHEKVQADCASAALCWFVSLVNPIIKGLNGTLWHLGKYAYSLSVRDLDKKIDVSLVGYWSDLKLQRWDEQDLTGGQDFFFFSPRPLNRLIWQRGFLMGVVCLLKYTNKHTTMKKY